MASTIAAVTTSGGGVVTTADASGNLNLLAGTTTVVALTTAGAAVTGTLSVSGATISATNAILTIGDNSRTVSTSKTTGAIVCGGGLGVWSDAYIGGSINLSGGTSGIAIIAASAVAGTPTITLPTTTGTVALTSQVIGVSQTTSNLTASRALNTTYTNSTGKPIVAYCCISNASASALMMNAIDGVTIYGGVDPTAGAYYSMTLVVPIGSTYLFNMNGTPTLQLWVETR